MPMRHGSSFLLRILDPESREFCQITTVTNKFFNCFCIDYSKIAARKRNLSEGLLISVFSFFSHFSDCQMCSMSQKYVQNAFPTGAVPRTPLGELKTLPRLPIVGWGWDIPPQTSPHSAPLVPRSSRLWRFPSVPPLHYLLPSLSRCRPNVLKGCNWRCHERSLIGSNVIGKKCQ